MLSMNLPFVVADLISIANPTIISLLAGSSRVVGGSHAVVE